MKAAVLVALLCAAGAEAKGYGTRSYTSPGKGKSKVWKYAAVGAAGAVAGAGAYYIGSKLYNVHTRYQHSNYDSYYNSRSSSWRNRHRRRTGTSGCTPQGGLREDSTDAWVIAQIVMNKTRGSFAPVELEVDLFNELLFRSPCKTPTQVVPLYECFLSTNRQISATDKQNAGACRLLGDVESLPEEHLEAKRKLLATGYMVYEVAVGADNLGDAVNYIVCVFFIFSSKWRVSIIQASCIVFT